MSDLISRQEAIARAVPLNLFGREVMIVSVSELENLPSAQPVRHGRWIGYPECLKHEGAGYDDVICSVCGEMFDIMDNDVERFAYCPHCGAKMDGEQEKQNDQTD